MPAEQFVHHPNAVACREADLLIQFHVYVGNWASFDDFATHFVVRIATIKAVAMMMDGPSFGHSRRSSVPTNSIKVF